MPAPAPAATGGGHPIGLEALVTSAGTVLFSLVVALATGILVIAFVAERARTGTPSWVSRAAATLAAREGAPLWGPLPARVVLGGLLVSLLGWRAADAGGPFTGVGSMGVALGLGVAILGGVMGTALAHPPAREQWVVDDAAIAHPLPARTRFAHRAVLPGAFGSGPVGAVVVVVGGIVALAGLPVAAMWRALEGRSLDGVLSAQVPLLAAVVAMAAGAWLLRAESRHAVASAHGATVRPRDAVETVGATAVLLALSVPIDLGAPAALVGVLGVVALGAARARLGYGGAVLAVVLAAAARGVCALATGTLAVPDVVPLLVPALLGAAAVEVALAVLGDRVLGAPRPGAARDRRPVVVR